VYVLCFLIRFAIGALLDEHIDTLLHVRVACGQVHHGFLGIYIDVNHC
jgi:hypothetical protein